jgi:hypothetical protein
MHKVLFLTLILSILISCTKNSENDISECMKEKIETFQIDKEARAVYKIKLNDEFHYWFHTGAVEYDGAEFIFDSNCKQICFYCGFCIPSDCIKKYPEYLSEKWEVVWKK